MIGNLISRCRRGTAVGWTVLLLAGSLTAQDEVSTPAEVWERIKGTEDPGVFEAYIDRYQNVSEAEIYVELAKFELEALPPAEWSNSLGMEFVRVPAGEFRMGSESGFADDDEKPVTRVKISRAFYLGKYEVTQGQWETVMGSNPSDFKNCGRDCPVESVSWDDVQQFVRELNGMEGGARYRLPTEAEWEYAARAGTRTDTPAGDLDLVGTSNAPMLDRIAWYGGNSGVRYDGGVDCSDWNEKQYPSTWCGTHPVGGKAVNDFGLHDMLGNAWEWVEDRYGEYPGGGSVTDPKGPATGFLRVRRGGGWSHDALGCRSAYRAGVIPGNRYHYLGFRLLRVE